VIVFTAAILALRGLKLRRAVMLAGRGSTAPTRVAEA
jgi:hypothetical protein